MPYQISQDSLLIRLTYAAYVSRDDVLNSAHAIIDLGSQCAHRPDQLTDLTAIKQSETGYDVLMPVGIERRTRTFPNTFKHAIVAPTELPFGLARMFQSLVSNPQIDTQIYKTVTEAEQWLSVPVIGPPTEGER
jgi:hypothetical protein